VIVSLLTRRPHVRMARYAGARFRTALIIWQINGDGEATVFEGTALISRLRDPRARSREFERDALLRRCAGEGPGERFPGGRGRAGDGDRGIDPVASGPSRRCSRSCWPAIALTGFAWLLS